MQFYFITFLLGLMWYEWYNSGKINSGIDKLSCTEKLVLKLKYGGSKRQKNSTAHYKGLLK